MPKLPTAAQQSSSILLLDGSTSRMNDGNDDALIGGKWEDEEERKFYEDITDLRDFIPKSLLGIEEGKSGTATRDEQSLKAEEEAEVKKLEEKMESMALRAAQEPAADE